ncbi:MAG: hypothetical protein KF741_04420 [Ferruginibacter sp.]|nr:hypothetical protein [Bacteroidota bacterium]MBX2918469.1 hypothetical protein [Ferruginibacter sp.]MCB0708287.1 hypothetical protein [Chitinophagaceae bacterium]MCC7378493.1 hypothetical protein [Chitinophagaceae bacterium]
MKTKWPAIFFTIALYIAVLAAFLITDKLPKRGANDISTGLMVAAISLPVITFFFLRSIYLAIKNDNSYWIITAVHLACFILLGMYLTF